MRMEYKIEKGYDILVVYRRDRFPFLSMDVNDSFLLDVSEHKAVYAAAKRYADRNPGWDYTIRKVEGGYRLWRVK